jgi:hypothetical protein
MATTLGDFGRESERFGDIPFYYGFPFRFWFGAHQIQPEDVESWCREHALGYYKTVTYTHKSSKRNRKGEYEDRVIYVDKIYLADERDALRIKLAFDVKETIVKDRPRIKNRRKVRRIKTK